MASVEEYRAVHGREPASRKDIQGEFGDGGCNVIRKAKGGVIGRWSSWESASKALNELQKLGFGYEYCLEESHEWVRETEYRTTCSACGLTRGVPVFAGRTMGIDWP